MSVRRSRSGLAIFLCGVLVLASRGAWASGQGNTQTTSSNGASSNSQSGSSNTSGDSSKSSGDSSKSSSNSSGDSSKDSNNSTQNSPKNSSDYTSNSSSDWTTNSHGAHIFSIALAVVLVGATAIGIGVSTRSHDLRLGAEDQRRLARALDGSREQGALLAALDGPIDEGQAERFAGAFMKLASRALGPARAQAMVRSTRLTCGD